MATAPRSQRNRKPPRPGNVQPFPTGLALNAICQAGGSQGCNIVFDKPLNAAAIGDITGWVFDLNPTIVLDNIWGNRMYFITEDQFDPTNQVDYDGSAELYFADGEKVPPFSLEMVAINSN